MNKPVPCESSWRAELCLSFEKRQYGQSYRTVLSHQQFEGPLRVQKPLYPEDDVCHIYLLHPPGGIVGGDQLSINVLAKPHSHSLITTPAANKFYRSVSRQATLQQHLQIQENACLEWLPQETILFNSSYPHITTQIQMHPSAKLVTWEILCLGRPAAGEQFEQGQVSQALEITIGHQRILTDRLRFAGGDPMLSAQWGFRGFPVIAYMVITPADADMRDAVRQFTLLDAQQNLTTTLIKNVLLCRYLGYHAQQARQQLSLIWNQIRPQLCQKKAITPRIWLT